MASSEADTKERVSFSERSDDQAPDWEVEARKTGWRPEGEFHGAKEKWIDAEQWVKRGEQFIPFLQASRRELQERQVSLEGQLAEQRRQNQAIMASLDELKGTVQQTTAAATQVQKDELMDAIVKAHEDGDIRKELQLRDQLAEVNEQLRAARTPKASGVPASGVQQSAETPEFLHFVSENPWFREDTVMAGAAVAAMGQLNTDAEKVKWPPDRKLAEVARIIKQRFGVASSSRRESPSRVESGRGESSGGGGRTFNDLPADARATCDALSKRFVGKQDAAGNIKYPDLAAYRTKYASDYFADDWGSQLKVQ